MKSIIEYKCKECGKVTKHYLTKNGEYKCMICGKVNKKAPREVVFVPDDALLDPKTFTEEYVKE